MNTTKISHIAHLVEICVQYGINKVVISPGSRNAPLIIAFDSHPKIETFLIHDERSAAFFAMGLAEESGSPVAITCTSGSAPINYAPAIAEAYYRNIPLLVLTADRPKELVDQGDGQTIRQKEMFANFIKQDFELPNFPDKTEKLLSDEIVNEALNSLMTKPVGPVHINIPLAEPLYEIEELRSTPIIRPIEKTDYKLSQTDKTVIKEGWGNAKKKLLLIGQIKPNELPIELLSPFLNDPSVAILVENTSNCTDFSRICHCIDRTLAIIKEDEIANFAPDLLITAGGAIISKKIKSFFRNNKPKANWRIGIFPFEEDTYQSLSSSFSVDFRHFSEYINELVFAPNSNFGSQWKQADFLAQGAHLNYVFQAPFSDLKVFEIILDTLPELSNLHMSNSSVVRYCQLFDPIRSVNYYSNRGVSGIDGSTSTALGISNNNKEKLNVLISGDTSFFYDSNALWNNYNTENLRIIVINNGGGGIFKIIDGPKKSNQLDYFVAPHKGSIKDLCKAFDVQYLSAKSLGELENNMEKFYQISGNKKPVLMEINTELCQNEVVLGEYFLKIKNEK